MEKNQLKYIENVENGKKFLLKSILSGVILPIADEVDVCNRREAEHE